MVGANAGFVELLKKHLEQRPHLRHNVCAKHGLARMLCTPLENAFGKAKQGEAGVLQYIYLAWYICNHYWSDLEALMLDNIEKCWNDDPSFRSALKEAFDSVRSWKTAAAALKKCPQPKDFRWGSICAVFDWLNRWRPLFEIACLEIWTFGKAGTFHELIGEWLNWNQSEKVRAQYLLANEYVTKFWKHWWLEVCNETPMGHSSDFGAFWMLS
jgi:hypothetical protein